MKIKMKKITAGRGVLLAMALYLTFVLSTLYVVPVAGRTEVAVEAEHHQAQEHPHPAQDQLLELHLERVILCVQT